MAALHEELRRNHVKALESISQLTKENVRALQRVEALTKENEALKTPSNGRAGRGGAGDESGGERPRADSTSVVETQHL